MRCADSALLVLRGRTEAARKCGGGEEATRRRLARRREAARTGRGDAEAAGGAGEREKERTLAGGNGTRPGWGCGAELGGAHTRDDFPYDLGRAEMRSSIRASQPSQAEEPFLHHVGRAEWPKPGYQTPEKLVGRAERRFSGEDRATKHALSSPELSKEVHNIPRVVVGE